MRIKDDKKKESIINATIKLVNEIGLVSSSVSKIAKEANVSPATIYVYYKNKEDLLVSIYINIKQTMGIAILKDFNSNLPVRDIMKKLWSNALKYLAANPGYFRYTEQFANSPICNLVNKQEINKFFDPMFNVLKRGIEQKIIKDVNFELLNVFIFYPVVVLSNANLSKILELDDEMIETSFTLAWDAIKL